MANISAKLNPYLSDLVVFYLKLHDLHWNVKGMQFMPVHKYTEAQYDDMAEKFDAVAEIMIMHGEKPVSNIADYVKLASIKEVSKDVYKDNEVLKILIDDMSTLKAEAESIRASMVEEDVFDVVALLEDHVAGYNKELWFLKSMLA